MGEQNYESISQFMGVNWQSLDNPERIRLLSEILEFLSPRELRELRNLADEKRLSKLEQTKIQLLEQMRPQLDELGIDPDEVEVTFSRPRKSRSDTGRTLPVKYRSPEGHTWSGRGSVPAWLQAREEQRYSREDFRVSD